MRRLSWLVALVAVPVLVAGSGPQEQAAPPWFRTRTDLVLVDVSVVDRDGVPVAGLQPDDFRVTVDFRPRKVVSVLFVSQAGAGEPVCAGFARDAVGPAVCHESDRRRRPDGCDRGGRAEPAARLDGAGVEVDRPIARQLRPVGPPGAGGVTGAAGGRGLHERLCPDYPVDKDDPVRPPDADQAPGGADAPPHRHPGARDPEWRRRRQPAGGRAVRRCCSAADAVGGAAADRGFGGGRVATQNLQGAAPR